MENKYGSRTTAEEVLKDVNLTGRTCVVTGGNSGIGTETVRALAAAGARVIFSSRNLEAGRAVAEQIKAGGVQGEVIVLQMDLADLSSVKFFAETLQKEQRVDYLIANAGVMACPYALTKDGFEMQIGTNVFGHFYLVQLLEENLKAQDHPCRIVALSSYGHVWGHIDLEDLHFKRGRKYGVWTGYGQSKLGNILWATELNNRFAGSKVTAYSVHPGGIRTNLGRHSNLIRFGTYIFNFLLKSIPQGAATTVYAATAPELEAHPGAYLEDCHISKPSAEGQDTALAKKFYEEVDAQIKAVIAGS